MNNETLHLKNYIQTTVKKHEDFRNSCINLVASENAMSPIVRSLLSTDLAQRYGDYTDRDLEARRYFGTEFIITLEQEVSRLACELFHTKYVELRPLSGHMAGNSVIQSLCNPGDTVLELGRFQGGHRLATKFADCPLISLDVRYLPFDDKEYNIDVEKTIQIIEEYHPRLVIVGASNFLFPIPLRELALGIKKISSDTILTYDASHVLGLIAGGLFQSPLDEGASLVFGGTQKSFPGPQGGLIYSNSYDLIERVSSGVYPASVSNHHLSRLPSLGIAMVEMKLWGSDYAKHVIENAKTLANELANLNIPIVSNGKVFTESHTVLIKTAELGKSDELGRLLEKAGIIVTAIHLPEALGREGLRLGTNEITRRGAKTEHIINIASLIADVIFKRRSYESIREEIQYLSRSLSSYAFTWLETI